MKIRRRARLRVHALLLWLLFAHVCGAQTSALDEQYAKLRSAIDSFNARCGQVRRDSELDRACREEKARLEAEQASYEAALNRYNAAANRSPAAPTSQKSFAAILNEERNRVMPSVAARAAHSNPVMRAFRRFLSEITTQLFEQDYGFVSDPALQSKLETLSAKLAQAGPYPDEPLAIKIVDLPKYPKQTQSVDQRIVQLGLDRNVQVSGNTIYVGRSYLMRNPPPSDDELLFVLGHESGHRNRDHATQKLIWTIPADLRNAIAEKLSPDQTTLSPKQRAFIRDQARKANWLADYTKADESEADRDGAYLAITAGAKPGGIHAAFQWMEGQEADHAPATAAEKRRVDLTRDHAPPQTRFTALQEIYGSALK